ncbi:MAG: isochorismatase family protein [Halofilum sp. (in: g-proteobacteria)]|nr:isochorismatase family protein [Halofilum sp. (in: g-proteobacteria)]
MSALRLLDAEQTVLLVVDVQTRLAASMPGDAWPGCRDAVCLLARAAGELDLPALVTRQYPRGLGDTDPAVAEALPAAAETVDKTCFCATHAPELARALEMTGRSQVLVCGMEAHVCVLQTVAGLARAGYEPFVAADAVCSRAPARAANALERMRAGGVTITNAESAVFEWLKGADHERFRNLQRLLK